MKKIIFPDFSDITGLPNDDSLLVDQHRMLFFGSADDLLICQKPVSEHFLGYLIHDIGLKIPTIHATHIDRPHQLHETVTPAALKKYLGDTKHIHLLPLMGNAGAHQFARSLRQAGYAVDIEAPEYSNFLQLNQKLGFRSIIRDLFGPYRQPKGYALRHSGAVRQLWLDSHAKEFILKPNQSTGGFANRILPHTGDLFEHAELFKGMDLIEELLPNIVASLSIHIYIDLKGRAKIMPLAEQVMASKSAANGLRYPTKITSKTLGNLMRDLEIFQEYLQSIRYRGNCNLDVVVNAQGRHYFIEANARLASGAVPRALLEKLFGSELPAYQFVERTLPGLSHLSEQQLLQHSLATLQLNQHTGTIVVQSEKLAFNKVAYVCFGRNQHEVAHQEQLFLERLGLSSTPLVA